MLEAVGHRVIELERVAFGPLRPARARLEPRLTQAEVDACAARTSGRA